MSSAASNIAAKNFLISEETPTVLVELFTSQGCPSCPPADAMLRSLKGTDGVMVLSWPIDYWDRLGWEDTFARSEHSMRQSAYNKRIGMSGVYTPQMIFNGIYEAKGSDKSMVTAALQKAKGRARLTLNPKLVISKDNVTINLPKAALEDGAQIRLVYFIEKASVAVRGGENNGRTLHYTHVVRQADVIKDWTGEPISLSMPLIKPESEVTHIAVLVHKRYGQGVVLGASAGKIPSE
ncbi:DUF1223 domain-containing protein [Temperatibacter marinus]|uniref:DUF1223 domain-containing protein n=1 Tax=Temperatibacter marinus TaxID=1456591 RepID=A0AA52EHR8_9PROT|nr:DUF1223 domain-containing protein [Temperatibacter marinus]WND03393.1 DUF1223 domain-containing protein [Temperatibacter marinus]